MRINRYRVSGVLFAIAAFAAGVTIADAGHCARCGGSGPCQKVCRLVTEEKTVQITCWGCKCEEFCLPGPSKPGCEHCQLVCGTCDKCRDGNSVQAQPMPFVWTNWIPGTAQIHTRKKLMKKIATKKVPSHKWVVEDLCDQCMHDSQQSTVPDIVAKQATTTNQK
jgi:hypothetical protein